MKTSLFILNVVSAIFIINFLFIDPSVTGLVVAPFGIKLDLGSPLGFALIFIIITIALDVYFYMKSRKK